MIHLKCWFVRALDKNPEDDTVKYLLLEAPSNKFKRCILSCSEAIDLLKQGHCVDTIFVAKQKSSSPTSQKVTFCQNQNKPILITTKTPSTFDVLPSVNSYIRYFYRTKSDELTLIQREKLVWDGKNLLKNLDKYTIANGRRNPNYCMG